MTDLETRIAKIEAVEDIKRLKARYAAACDDAYNPMTMETLFTEDATWSAGPFGRYEGREAIVEFFRGVSSSITWALHYMLTPIIEVDDGAVTASGSWYLWMPFTAVADHGPQAAWVAGLYDDRYRREAHGWRISSIDADIQIMSPYEDGWVKTPVMG
ncbi:MAG: nuclear transport factor 2 family protein [Gaiellales bacterium]